jgi:hypothetical protein
LVVSIVKPELTSVLIGRVALVERRMLKLKAKFESSGSSQFSFRR